MAEPSRCLGKHVALQVHRAALTLGFGQPGADVRDSDASGIGVGSVDDADRESRYMQLRDEVGSLGDDRIEGLLASQALRNVLNLLRNIFKIVFLTEGRRK